MTPTDRTRVDLTGWPVSLIVADRRVVVVGAGSIAARKISGLIQAGADVVVVAPSAVPDVQSWSREGRIKWLERGFEASDLDDAWLAVTATDDPAVNRAVRAAGDERRMFVNAADDPRNCSFTLMSVVRRGGVVVAVGTGGRSPALATWLKARMADELGPEYEVLLEILEAERDEIRASGRSTEELDWQRALDEGILVLVREGRLDEARERLRSCL